MPQLDFLTYSSQLFWFVIVFAILYIIICFCVVPRLEYILTQRKDLIIDNTEKAKTIITQIHMWQARYEYELETIYASYNENVKNMKNQLEKDFEYNKDLIMQKHKKQLAELANMYENNTREFMDQYIRSVVTEILTYCTKYIISNKIDKNLIENIVTHGLLIS